MGRGKRSGKNKEGKRISFILAKYQPDYNIYKKIDRGVYYAIY